MPFFEAGRDALGHFVVAGVVRLARSRHELVAKLFERVPRPGRVPRPFLQVGDGAIDRPVVTADAPAPPGTRVENGGVRSDAVANPATGGQRDHRPDA